MRHILPFLIIILNYQNAMMYAPNYNGAPYPQQGDSLSPAGRMGHNSVDEHNYNRQAHIHNQMYNLGLKEGVTNMIIIGSTFMLSTFSFVLSVCGIIATGSSNQNYDKLLIAFNGKEHLILGTHSYLGKTIIVASSFCIFFSIIVIVTQSHIVYSMMCQKNHNNN